MFLYIGFYQRSVLFFFCGPSLIDLSRILLFEKLYLDASARRFFGPWNTDIKYLIKYSSLMVTRRWKWDWRVFARLWLGDFNDDNALKGLRCVRLGGLQ